jgi:SAM-dependent methyltransferase
MTSPQIELIRRLFAGEELPAQGPVAELVRAHPERVEQARALVATGLDAPDTPEGARALFDRLAVQAPEAGVALYALGDPGLLDAATQELVDVVEAWRPIAGRDLLDFGCGIGRVSRELARRGARVTGLDVSPGMIADADRRGGDVRYLVGNGRDLSALADQSLDLVLAADSLPYLVAAGLLERHLAEFARVLRPGGALIVFNWSYRGDAALDAVEAGAAQGFLLRRSGERPFAIWDATGFLLQRV